MEIYHSGQKPSIYSFLHLFLSIREYQRNKIEEDGSEMGARVWTCCQAWLYNTRDSKQRWTLLFTHFLRDESSNRHGRAAALEFRISCGSHTLSQTLFSMQILVFESGLLWRQSWTKWPLRYGKYLVWWWRPRGEGGGGGGDKFYLLMALHHQILASIIRPHQFHLILMEHYAYLVPSQTGCKWGEMAQSSTAISITALWCMAFLVMNNFFYIGDSGWQYGCTAFSDTPWKVEADQKLCGLLVRVCADILNLSSILYIQYI